MNAILLRTSQEAAVVMKDGTTVVVMTVKFYLHKSRIPPITVDQKSIKVLIVKGKPNVLYTKSSHI